MRLCTVGANLLLTAQLASSLSVDLPDKLETRNVLQSRAADPLDEVVYLADCRKYRDKNADDKNFAERISLALYHDTWDYTRKNDSLRWGAIATPSYPTSQRVEVMGGAFVDWLAAKQDDRINAKFETMGRRFWVHGLSEKGSPETGATGTASLGDMDMRCYKDGIDTDFTFNKWHYRCNAQYSCTRARRQIRRTLISVSESFATVDILSLSPRKLKLKPGQYSPRINGIIGNVYFSLGLLDPKKGFTADEIVIEPEFKVQNGNKRHSVRFDWKAGQVSSDATYNPGRIKSVAEELDRTLVPQIEKRVREAGETHWDKTWWIYKTEFPAQVKVQLQIAFQEQLDWKDTDVIVIDIISHKNKSCGKEAAWAKVLAGLFAGGAALVTGGASAVLSGLGGVMGGVHTASCLSS